MLSVKYVDAQDPVYHIKYVAQNPVYHIKYVAAQDSVYFAFF
jgi:hypothetical protein